MTERWRGFVAVLALVVVAAFGGDGWCAAPAADPRVATVAGYLDALGARDWPAARAAWRPVDQARADRLGIRYSDLPLKIDGDSPLCRAAAGVGLVERHVMPPDDHPLGALLAYPPPLAGVGVTGVGLNHTYLLAEDAADWRLASPVGVVLDDCARRPGAVATGRYVRAISGPDMDGRVPALAALDSFVTVTLDRLQVSPGRRRLLEREKIDYLFVSPEWVELLAGAPTVGVANLQLDVVVTHHPCHLHEMAHILVNFWLEELPLYALPALQEGLATHLGGRWGRGPEFLAQVGKMLLESGFVDLNGLLPREEFHRMGADMTYAPAGVLAGWLLEQAGPSALAQTCLRLSGTLEALQALTADQVAAALGAPLGLADADVEAVEAALTSHLATLPGNPLRAASAATASGEPLRLLRDGGLELRLWRQDSEWVVAITAPPGAIPRGALLVPGVDTGSASALHTEHFPDAAQPAARAALRFSTDEAGWYDYGRDLLVAKHIDSFWPEPPAYDPQTRTLRLAWPVGLVPWDLEGGNLVLQAVAGD